MRDGATGGAAFDSTATKTFANVDSAVAQEDMTLPSTFTGTVEVLATGNKSVGDPLQYTHTSVTDRGRQHHSPGQRRASDLSGWGFNTPLPPSSTVSEERYVVGKLYGVPDSGVVVVVNVRKGDVLRGQPARP